MAGMRARNFCVRCRAFRKGKFMTLADFVCDLCVEEQHMIYELKKRKGELNDISRSIV